MSKLYNIEIWSISLSITIISLFISLAYSQIFKVEWTYIQLFSIFLPLYLCGAYYINTRLKEIEHLEKLENPEK